MKNFVMAGLISLLSVGTAVAQGPCIPTQQANNILQGAGERPYFLGFDKERNLIELWYNSTNRTWTFVLVQEGKKCLVTNGFGGLFYEPMVPPIGEDG